MTAINIFRQRYSVAVLTDTAGYGADGIVRGFISKCATIPHMRAAIATRGSSIATAIFASAFGENCASFDDLVRTGGALAERVYDEVLYALAQSQETEVDIMLAGWSEERNRAESYVMSSSAMHGFDPWEFHEAPAVVAGPVPSDEALARAGVDVTQNPDKVDPVSVGLKVLEAQRSMKFPATTAGGEEYHLVGGAAVLTQITRDGISQRIIHRWSDRIGERITPEIVAHPVSEHPMSRQQRRAMERQQRKGRVAV